MMNFSRRRFSEIAHRWYSSAFVLSDDGEEERAQLLNENTTFRTTCCEKVWILVLALIFVVGVSASTYLLIVEGRDPIPSSFTLVSRNEWTSWTRCRNTSQLQLPVQRILLLPTNTTECWNEWDCPKGLRNLQKQHIEKLNETDIFYNFILAGDNRIYEGRGWNCSSSYESNGGQLLTIAFFGTYDYRPPTPKQVNILQNFLEYSIERNRLLKCYQILFQDSTTTYITDVAFELQSRKSLC